MEFSPTFLDFSSWIYLFWKQTKINLVSKYFRFYLTEQVAYTIFEVAPNKKFILLCRLIMAFLICCLNFMQEKTDKSHKFCDM